MADPEWNWADEAERENWFERIKHKAREDARADLGLYGEGEGEWEAAGGDEWEIISPGAARR